MYQSLFRKIFPCWEEISPEDRALLCASTSEVGYQKGAAVHTNAECTGVIILKSGTLRAYISSDAGKEITVYRLFPGELCIYSASCVLRSITFDVCVEADEDSVCYVIDGEVFASVANRDLRLKNFALEAATARFSDVMWIMQQILFMSFDTRLAIFLLDESANLKSDTLPLTHEQIAKYMGSAREVVSRMLKYFAQEGMVTLSRGGVTLLDKSRLRALTR